MVDGLFGSQERTGLVEETWHDHSNADEFDQDRGTRTVQVPAVSLRSVRFLTGHCVATAAL